LRGGVSVCELVWHQSLFCHPERSGCVLCIHRVEGYLLHGNGFKDRDPSTAQELASRTLAPLRM